MDKTYSELIQYKEISKKIEEGYTFQISYSNFDEVFTASLYGKEVIEAEEKDFYKSISKLLKKMNLSQDIQQLELDKSLIKVLKEREFLYISKNNDYIKLLLEDFRIDGTSFEEVYLKLLEEIKNGNEGRYHQMYGIQDLDEEVD